MTIKIEVDVTSTPPGQLIKLAKYMLECAGYTEQVAAPGPVERTAPLVTREPVTSITTDEEEVVGQFDLNLAATQAPGIEVDSAGMPWDYRIHASSRAKVADGTWRQRRNLDPNVLAQVQAEMLQVMGLPIPTAGSGSQQEEQPSADPIAEADPEQAFIDAVIPPPPPPAAPAVAVPVPPPFAHSAAVPVAPVAIAPPPPSTPAGAATTASLSSQPVTFPQLVSRITKMLAAKELTQGDIAGACQSLGIPHMPALASRPDLIPSMATALGIAL